MPAPAATPNPNPYAAPRAVLADSAPAGPTPRLRYWFLRSFWTSFVSALLTISVLLGGHSLEAFLLCFTISLVTVLAYLATLALVATSIGKNPLLWLAGAILFAPFGYLIAYSRMLSLIDPEELVGGLAPGHPQGQHQEQG
jgi:hypothetical protein